MLWGISRRGIRPLGGGNQEGWGCAGSWDTVSFRYCHTALLPSPGAQVMLNGAGRCTRGAPGCGSGKVPGCPAGLSSLLGIRTLPERWRAEAKCLEPRGVRADTVGKPRSTEGRGCGAGSLWIHGGCYDTSDYINNSLNKTTCDHILFAIPQCSADSTQALATLVY